ncbi:MAG: bifunctional UDP-3-O-[3-hydroxymyristoyl] N-acetylglucosamine deacetylase/3-hydroxyacyl-ACP dehydratase [Candidatus Latescibacteria bacterium]|nr:bifunctional UDP-3-O-[3-hydroxymyristoyl] N-acetylglucosamine deacetylase/3-hydroxyacyl-ACP dehydratase [Candidatus Latescibacterota bacterium]
MFEKQATVAGEVCVEGIGLHTGTPSKVTFRPAPINTGVVFRKIDLENAPEIPALIEYVQDLSRGTTIGIGDVKIHTVEHVLAAFAGLKVDNAYVDIRGIEPPVCDGSSLEFVKAIKKEGIEEQDSPRDYIYIEENILFDAVKGEGVELLALPSDDFRITFMVDYRNPAIGTQYTSMYSMDEFESEYAASRTFCFLSEVEMLKEAGLAKGGTPENSLVVIDKPWNEKEVTYLKSLFDKGMEVSKGENGILNGIELRFPNEFVRHKTLDLIGDLFLVGHPIKGHIMAARSGHKANIELVRKIRAYWEKNRIKMKYQNKKTSGYLFDIDAIRKIMPHRYPFLLIDRIIDLVPGKKVVGIKNVTINEPFFQGHFPDRPVMPGVLLLEAMAQVGGILMLDAEIKTEDKLIFFTGINKAKFRKPVEPGDQVRFELEIVRRRQSYYSMAGKGYVSDDIVVEAELSATIIQREDSAR